MTNYSGTLSCGSFVVAEAQQKGDHALIQLRELLSEIESQPLLTASVNVAWIPEIFSGILGYSMILEGLPPPQLSGRGPDHPSLEA